MRVLLLLGCLMVQAIEGRDGSKPSVDKLIVAYARALSNADGADISTVFAEDAVWMPADAPLVSGRAAIASAVKGQQAPPVNLRDVEVIDADVQGDRMTITGTMTLRLAGSHGRPAKFISIYKRVNNQWLIAYGIVNFDAPMSRAQN